MRVPVVEDHQHIAIEVRDHLFDERGDRVPVVGGTYSVAPDGTVQGDGVFADRGGGSRRRAASVARSWTIIRGGMNGTAHPVKRMSSIIG